MDRTKAIEKASLVGLVGHALLSALKISLGLYTRSLSLIGIGLDSSTDVITSLVTLFTARFAAKPPDMAHPYGHGRAETIATKGFSFLIFFAGAQLGIATVRNIVENVPAPLPEPIIIYVALAAMAGKACIFLYTRYTAKGAASQMLMANARHMMGDIILYGGVWVGVFFSSILQFPLIDWIMACGLSLWIMRIALGIFLESSEELMEGTPDASIYRSIFQAVDKIPGAGNPHRARVRKLNGLKVIDLDIEVDGRISVEKGHRIAVAVEEAIKEEVNNVYDIVVHVEPEGNWEVERYGLSEKKLEGLSQL